MRLSCHFFRKCFRSSRVHRYRSDCREQSCDLEILQIQPAGRTIMNGVQLTAMIFHPICKPSEKSEHLRISVWKVWPIRSSLAHVLLNLSDGQDFVTYTVAHHQEVVKMFWLYFEGVLVLSGSRLFTLWDLRVWWADPDKARWSAKDCKAVTDYHFMKLR